MSRMEAKSSGNCDLRPKVENEKGFENGQSSLGSKSGTCTHTLRCSAGTQATVCQWYEQFHGLSMQSSVSDHK